jgi:hypothetical protein
VPCGHKKYKKWKKLKKCDIFEKKIINKHSLKFELVYMLKNCVDHRPGNGRWVGGWVDEWVKSWSKGLLSAVKKLLT